MSASFDYISLRAATLSYTSLYFLVPSIGLDMQQGLDGDLVPELLNE